ncbi:hypothetical protein [Mycolicibacterium vanbaalenii]|nr:hypothetical protein [Mycolicibacterium vanbaalenii]
MIASDRTVGIDNPWEVTMDEWGLQTWHDYVILGLLIGGQAFACAFLIWDRRSKRWRRGQR